MTVTIWHNPRCSKSRNTLALLLENGHKPEIVEYLKTPPPTDAIEKACSQLGVETRQMMRTGEATYKELGLAIVEDAETLIKAMADNPILIERPIVFHGDHAKIGRPPEAVLEIL